MCGIAGIIDQNSSSSNESLMLQMLDSMEHRGPDGKGSWQDKSAKVTLGHRRLAIIELSDQGSQPMHFSDRYVITFNGEIYNYIELRKELQALGRTFKTATDTEVLLCAYDQFKEKCLSKIDGMFAFAIYDRSEQTLFCARDRFGEKPFFYSYHDGKFFFASEMKALWAAGVPKELDHLMMQQFSETTAVLDKTQPSKTFYKKCHRLKNATYFKSSVFDIKVNPQGYWQPPTNFGTNQISFEDACSEFKRLLTESVERRLRADTNVGSSLSGGLDSSTTVSIIDQLNEGKREQHTFTARFKNFDKDEGKFVDELCAKYPSIVRHDVWPTDDSLLDDFSKLVHAQEEPFQSGSIYAQFKVYEQARKENIIVMLDGQGADEYLAGYKRFYDDYLRMLFYSDKKKYKKELAGFNAIHPNFAKPDWFETESMKSRISRKVKSTLDKNHFSSGHELHESLRTQLFDHGLNWLLRFADRNAMANSVETRLPFLYHELVEFAFSLPVHFFLHEGWTKFILRTSFENRLCDSITWRKEKVGYEPPQANWLANPDLQAKVKKADEYILDHAINASKVNEWSKLMIHEYAM